MGVYGFAPCIDNTFTTLSIYFCFKVEKNLPSNSQVLKNEYKNLGTFFFFRKNKFIDFGCDSISMDI